MDQSDPPPGYRGDRPLSIIFVQNHAKTIANRMTLAYVMNQLEGSPFGDPRNRAILRAAYAALKVG